MSEKKKTYFERFLETEINSLFNGNIGFSCEEMLIKDRDAIRFKCTYLDTDIWFRNYVIFTQDKRTVKRIYYLITHFLNGLEEKYGLDIRKGYFEAKKDEGRITNTECRITK